MIFQMMQLIAVPWQWTSYIRCMPPSTKWKMRVRLLLLSSSCTSLISSIVLDQAKLPSPFHRTDINSNEYKFLVHTAPLFRNLPYPKNLTVTAMSLDDLKNKSSKLSISLLSHIFILNHPPLKPFLQPQNQPLCPHPTPCNNFQTLTWPKTVQTFPTN